MAVEIDAQAVVAEAQRITEEQTSKGYAWAPTVDLRYGVINGVIKPLLTHLSPIAPPPPIIPNAPEAGREDFQAQRRRHPL